MRTIKVLCLYCKEADSFLVKSAVSRSTRHFINRTVNEDMKLEFGTPYEIDTDRVIYINEPCRLATLTAYIGVKYVIDCALVSPISADISLLSADSPFHWEDYKQSAESTFKIYQRDFVIANICRAFWASIQPLN